MPPNSADPALARALQDLGCAGAAQLAIGGLPARELAASFGTPLYVFDAAVLRARLQQVRAALGARVRVLWSVKANPSLAVASCLRAAGAGAEVASLGELHLALAAGHAAADLRFAGPGKTDAEIDAAVAAGLGCFHVESAQELASIAHAARARGAAAGVALRVNLARELGGSRLRMGGASSRFGVDEDQVPELVRTILREPGLHLRGLHVYAGTQCFDAAAFVQHAKALVVRAAGWEQQLGVAFDELDLGGGFGSAAFAGDPEFDLAGAGRGVQELVAEHDRRSRTWFVELGRFLCGPAGVYLTTVVRSKQSGGRTHVVLDGGMHQHAAAAGVGTVLRRNPLLVHADRLDGGTTHAVVLGGPLCTPADQFGDEVELPPLAPGELVAVLHAGAYGLSFSPHGFLSHATPAEVLVDEGRARVVRRRGAVQDVLRDQMP
ncbi:MAG TPA: alanine racemase [Planctomycetota bacterium]|nr:alanine racemase [Planctomycetota bacterium]